MCRSEHLIIKSFLGRSSCLCGFENCWPGAETLRRHAGDVQSFCGKLPPLLLFFGPVPSFSGGFSLVGFLLGPGRSSLAGGKAVKEMVRFIKESPGKPQQQLLPPGMPVKRWS